VEQGAEIVAGSWCRSQRTKTHCRCCGNRHTGRRFGGVRDQGRDPVRLLDQLYLLRPPDGEYSRNLTLRGRIPPAYGRARSWPKVKRHWTRYFSRSARPGQLWTMTSLWAPLDQPASPVWNKYRGRGVFLEEFMKTARGPECTVF
jgi:hypothetical protein